MSIEKDLNKISAFRSKAAKYLKEKATLSDAEINSPIFNYDETISGIKMGIKTEWSQKISKEVLVGLTALWDSID